MRVSIFKSPFQEQPIAVDCCRDAVYSMMLSDGYKHSSDIQSSSIMVFHMFTTEVFI